NETKSPVYAGDRFPPDSWNRHTLRIRPDRCRTPSMCAEKHFAGAANPGIDPSHSLPACALWPRFSSSRLRSRMMFLVNVLQTIKSKMRIDLRSRDVRVPEDCLDRAKISAIFDHVRGAAVSQHMRSGIGSCGARSGLQHLPDPLSCKLAASSSEKYERRTFLASQHVPRRSHIGSQRVHSRSPERHDALLVAFASHQYVSQIDFQILH